jgi:DNA-binding CsgD family transcriptional regulator
MRLRMICADKSLVEGPAYLTAGECYHVGRSSRCAFVVNDLSVSRCHAELTVSDRGLRVKDLKSRNGTFVDGKRIDATEVQAGQSLRFGSVRFHLLGEEVDVSGDDISGVSTHFVPNQAVPHPDGMKILSVAQGKVLELLLIGLQEKEVATKLDISQNTVHNHVKRIYKKLNVSSRAELLALFIVEKPADSAK